MSNAVTMQTTSVQRALEVVEIAKPLQLNLNRPIPIPSPQQILIKVLVVGLNPHDAKSLSRGLFLTPPFTEHSVLPAVLGNDVVGRIVSIGDAVRTPSPLSIGDIVVTQADLRHNISAGGVTSPQNGLQEHAVVDPEFTALVPPGLPDGLDAMAAVPTNAIASLFALFAPPMNGVGGLDIPAPWMRGVSTEWKQKVDHFDYAGTTVLVVGGGSNCGRWAVQLLRLAGIGKIVVVGGDEKELKALGATVVISRHGTESEVLQRAQEATGDRLLYAFDAVNPPSGQLLAARALSKNAHGTLSRLVRNPPLDLKEQVTDKMAGFDVVNVMGGSQLNPEIAVPFWERLEGWMSNGDLKSTPYVRQSIGADWSDAANKVNNLLNQYDEGAWVVKTHFHFIE